MGSYVMWITIAILAVFLIAGLVAGLIRGLKRSSLHIIFMVASFIIAFLVTKPITEMILQINIPVDGGELPLNQYIASLIQESFDLSNFDTASTFLERMPSAIVSPILFILITLVIYGLCNTIYLVVARISFGKKKEDFKKHKPHRFFGGIVGMAEAFLFMFILFAPLTSLTKTYQEIAELPPASAEAVSTEEGGSERTKTIAETLNENAPELNEIIFAYNDSVIGKIAGAGGLDNAIFDKLSNFELNGEEINFRTEIVTLADTYDEFVVVYNNINDKNYLSVDLSKLKSNIEKFLDNGIFKTIVTDTIKDFVLKFDELEITDAPELLTNMVDELQVKFSVEGFDMYQYLKHDILKFVDTVDVLFKSGIIESFEALETTDIESVLEIIDQKAENFGDVLEGVLGLNIVNDTFNSIGKFVSEQMKETIDKDGTLEIALNTNIDKSVLVDEVVAAIDEFVKITDYISISELTNSENPVSSLTEIEDIEGAMVQIGKAFDAVRDLDILVLPVEEGVRTEKVYVFDNILKTLNFELLGDEVYVSLTDSQPTSLDTYTKFFGYIKTPIKMAQDLELFDSEATFDEILDKVLVGLKSNEGLLSGFLLPFYQLDEASFDITTEDATFKVMVFDTVIDLLGSNTNGLLDFTEVKTADNILVWNEELTYIGKTLNNLNTGKIGAEEKTYIKYMLETDADLELVMKDMINTDIDQTTDGVQTNLKPTLKTIFDARVFAQFEENIFDIIDSSITDFTGVNPNTDTTNIDATQESVLNTIEEMLRITLNVEDGQSLTLSQIGQLMDVLKLNAYNDTTADQTNNGSKNGVFNNIFCNIISYMTGENLNGADLTGLKENSNREDIKQYIDRKYSELGEDKYYLIDYKTMMSELEDVITLAENLKTNMPENVSINTAEGITELVNAIETSINEFGETKATVIENMSNLVTETKYNFISEEDKANTTQVSAVVSAINEKFTETGVADALIKLLGLENTVA